MSGVAGAIAGAAVVGAGATMYASSQAASATKDASNAAIQQQKDALAQQAALSAPYRGLGESAMGAYQNLLGIGKGGQIDPTKAMQTLQQMPGYQFQLQQGLDAATAKANAMGLGLSGNTLQALTNYGQGLASTSYQQELQNLLNPIQIGQAAAAGQAANIGQTASNIGNIGINQANTLAGIRSNEASGLVGALGQGVNQYTTMNTLQGLMGTGGSFTPATWNANITNEIQGLNAGLPAIGSYGAI